MDLFKYLNERENITVPDPHGPLNKHISSSSIEEASKEVDSCYKEISKEKKRSYDFAMGASAESQGGEIYGSKRH